MAALAAQPVSSQVRVIGAKYRQAVVLIVRPPAGGVLFCSRALGCEVFRGREGMSEMR